ncbi:MAG TPA: BsuBI/PstI family type II restriction endonuclease [Longimicrobiaceae bacterium]
MSGIVLPPLPELDTIHARLPRIFPEGTEQRNYLVRNIAAKTVFVMFYVGAVEGWERWLRPNQVVRMTDEQAARVSDEERAAWTEASLKPNAVVGAGRWFADNSREPIRDETIKEGLIRVGAVVERPGLAPTSQHPRYALAADFARLFLAGDDELADEAAAWQRSHLSAGALARVQLVRRAAAAGTAGDAVLVRFPNGESRHMAAGPSTEITRAVVEDFAPRFLRTPAVVWVSESKRKVVARDEELARAVGLPIEAHKVLPDIILADLATPDPLLVFVEAVASDGPISDARRRDLLRILEEGGHDPRNAAFVTAFLDRGVGPWRRLAPSIAWDSFVWFVSEPDRIVVHRTLEPEGPRLSDLIGR